MIDLISQVFFAGLGAMIPALIVGFLTRWFHRQANTHADVEIDQLMYLFGGIAWFVSFVALLIGG